MSPLAKRVSRLLDEVDPVGIAPIHEHPELAMEYGPEAVEISELIESGQLTEQTLKAVWDNWFGNASPYKSADDPALADLLSRIRAVV